MNEAEKKEMARFWPRGLIKQMPTLERVMEAVKQGRGDYSTLAEVCLKLLKNLVQANERIDLYEKELEKQRGIIQKMTLERLSDTCRIRYLLDELQRGQHHLSPNTSPTESHTSSNKQKEDKP